MGERERQEVEVGNCPLEMHNARGAKVSAGREWNSSEGEGKSPKGFTGLGGKLEKGGLKSLGTGGEGIAVKTGKWTLAKS